MLLGEGADFVQPEKEGGVGFDNDGGEAGFGGDADGVGSDDGDIEAHVLAGFGGFKEDGTGGEGAAAADGGVGAVVAFDGEDGAFFDDEGLADVEGGDLFEDGPGEVDIAAEVAGGLGAGDPAGRGEEVFEVGGGGEEADTGGGEGVGDGAEEAFGVAFLKAGQEEKGFEVGAEVEEAARGDLAGHDGAVDASLAEEIEEAAELADAHPAGLVGCLGEVGGGLALEGGETDGGGAGLTGRIEEQAGVEALTGNKSQGGHGGQTKP